jgi:SAM-dependent methyltransferase
MRSSVPDLESTRGSKTHTVAEWDRDVQRFRRWSPTMSRPCPPLQPTPLVARAVAIVLGLFTLGAVVAAPPGVPKVETAPPTAAPEMPSTGPATPTTTEPEAVAMFDLRRLPTDAVPSSGIDPGEIALFLLAEAAGPNGIVERHRDWIVARGTPAAINAVRRAHANLVGGIVPPARMQVILLEIDRSHSDARDILDLLGSGQVSPASLAGIEASPAATVIARPSFADPIESAAMPLLEKAEDSKFELTVDVPSLDGNPGRYRVTFEQARERTLGRRRDRTGHRFEGDAKISRASYSAILAAPFAEAEVRELDGGRRRIELAAPTTLGESIAILLRLEPMPIEDAGTRGPVYRPMQATRDGIGVAYFDREIAQVMGHFAAGWLERPEREREERTDLLVDMLGLRPGMAVADIGAGSGYFTRRMSPKVGPTGRIYATDIQPEMLRILGEGLQREGIENVEPILGRIDDTGLASESVDLILLVDVYHEFDHPWEMARSMHRALRPGGRVALVEYRAGDPNVPIKPLHTMTEAQARLEYEAAGFRLVDSRIDGLPWQRLMLFEKRPDGQPTNPGTGVAPEAR